MATEYVLEGTYCSSDYCEVAVAVPGVPPTAIGFPTPDVGLFPAAMPEVERVTVTASPPTTTLPWGPYGAVTAVVLKTHAGNRIFSPVAVDPIYGVPPAVGRYVTLLDLDELILGQGGSGSTLVTQITSTELPSTSMLFSNEDGFFSQLAATEYLLGMSESIYEDLGSGQYVFGGRAEIQTIEIRRKTCRVRIGA